MKGLSILVLLSSVVLLCSAAPALQPVTCNEDGTAARLAMHHINAYHEHGYKFRLLQEQGRKIDSTPTGCNMELNLELGETDCHTVNPKHFEDCEFRMETDRPVSAICTVKMSLVLSDARVHSFTCTTKEAFTVAEMAMTCPGCPPLSPLNDENGLLAVDAAVKKFNENTSNAHYFVLKEVGRMKVVYIPMRGTRYNSVEIALQESNCPMHSRIVLSACQPLCSERAQHAFCKASYFPSSGLVTSLDCEYYPAAITDPPGPGEETTCSPPFPGNVGPPVPPGPVEQVPGGLSPQPPPAMHHCHADHSSTFHPICDWSSPQ